MLNFLHFLLILINIIPKLLAIDSLLKIVFINGENLIRCSDKDLRYITTTCLSQEDYRRIITCENRFNYLIESFIRLEWKNFSIICNQKNESVRERLDIIADVDQISSDDLFEIQHEVEFSHEIYPLLLRTDDEILTFESKDIPIRDLVMDSPTKKIYLRFHNQPMLCRIQFKTRPTVLCSSKENIADEYNFACYYDLNSRREPSIELMEAEFKQIESMMSLDDSSGVSKFESQRPVCERTDHFHQDSPFFFFR